MKGTASSPTPSYKRSSMRIRSRGTVTASRACLNLHPTCRSACRRSLCARLPMSRSRKCTCRARISLWAWCSVSPPSWSGRRCFKAVAPVSEGKAKFIVMDAQPKHQGVPLFRLRKANCPTHSPLHPGPQMHVLALAFLRVLLPHVGLRGLDMPLVGAPSVRVKLRDAQGCQQLWQPQADVVLTPAKHIRQPLPRVGLNGVPQPTRRRFFAYIPP